MNFKPFIMQLANYGLQNYLALLCQNQHIPISKFSIFFFFKPKASDIKSLPAGIL